LYGLPCKGTSDQSGKAETSREAIANCMVCLAKEQVINLKMARGKAETCREKLCKNILVIKTLNKFCLTTFCYSIQHNGDVAPERQKGKYSEVEY
jgi:hypothetical protein